MNDISMDGIIDVRSISGNAGLIELPRSAVRTYFQAFSKEELCFPTDSSLLTDPRIPRFLTTLYYNHAISGKKSSIHFIAPDNKGNYDIIIKALGENGAIGEKHLTFAVE